MLLADVATASLAVGATTKRSEKAAHVAACLRRADPTEVPAVVAYLSGELLQRRTGVGWASLRDLPAPAPVASLTVAQVDRTLAEVAAVSGPGSVARRADLVSDLFGRATEPEQALLRGLLTGELRQGALEGVMLDAVAKASGLPATDVRRAVMLRGAVGPVAAAALADGAAGLAEFRLQVGRPVQPMLASPGDDVAAALARLGTAALEWKLDGVRVQVHRDGSDVAVFTRSLDDITDRVPDVVHAVLALPVRTVVLDGEAIALRRDGRPQPFQVTGSRVGSRVDVAAVVRTIPLSTYAFDVLHLDGDDLLARPGRERFEALRAAVPEGMRVPRVVTGDLAEAEAFVADALARGHEGVVAKALDAPYEAGRRGAGWLKVKPRHTLDLVVLAAEWGHGRRRGWLSNLHLGARDRAGGGSVVVDESVRAPEVPVGWVPVGKTFKGMTDEMLAWQTQRFTELAVSPETIRDSYVVPLRPEQVVEIAFDGVQRSSRYAGGVALRFARVLRYRDDKGAAEADEITAIRALLPESER